MASGRQTRRQRAERQQSPALQQEKALLNHLLRLHRKVYPARARES
jgi:hypothetical protein